MSGSSFNKTREYIAATWETLTRYPDRCPTFKDPKTPGEPALYLPAGATASDSLQRLRALCSIQLLNLPLRIRGAGTFDPSQLKTEGLLYLPNAYVVPGGQFNEMYGWDSYFIIRGLILDGRVDTAKAMLENFFYEIQNYGAVLNANRTYYLTRSQPPFLTSMILAVYQAERQSGKKDPQWFARAYGYAVRDYEQWTSAPHLAGETGLSRYFDHGKGPAPEMVSDPAGYYEEVARYFAEHDKDGERYLQPIVEGQANQSYEGLIYTVGSPCADAEKGSETNCGPKRRVALTAAYYKGDRSMRESGFDVTYRFGPAGAGTENFAPVCLNSLLYKTENDLAEISKMLGKAEDAAKWTEKAAKRRQLVDRYFWDEADGEYFDYDFAEKKISSYEYATTFYPLWVGLASPQQAAAVMRNLKRFREPGGIVTSLNNSGAQWDYPYGWAPIQLLACEGMRRYGYNTEADGVSTDFIRMVERNFLRDGTIREKYDVVAGTSQTHIQEGYEQNEDGFGWTNATFAVLAGELPKRQLDELMLQ